MCSSTTTLSLEQPSFHSDYYGCIWSPHHRFPSQLFIYSHFFQWKTEAWWHLLGISEGSGICVHVCRCVCVSICPTLVFCCTCPRFSDLCMLFPGKKFIMPLMLQSEMERQPSAVLGLAWSCPNDTVAQGGDTCKRHLHLYHTMEYCCWNARLAQFACKNISHPSLAQSWTIFLKICSRFGFFL